MKSNSVNAMHILVILLLVYTSITCGTLSSIRSEGTYLDEAKYPVTSPDKIKVIGDSELENVKHGRVAFVEATGKGQMSSRVALINELKKRAGLMGANAIVMPQFKLVTVGDDVFVARTVVARTLAVRLLDN